MSRSPASRFSRGHSASPYLRRPSVASKGEREGEGRAVAEPFAEPLRGCQPNSCAASRRVVQAKSVPFFLGRKALSEEFFGIVSGEIPTPIVDHSNLKRPRSHAVVRHRDILVGGARMHRRHPWALRSRLTRNLQHFVLLDRDLRDSMEFACQRHTVPREGAPIDRQDILDKGLDIDRFP